MDGFLLKTLALLVVLPPANLFILFLIGLWIGRYRKRFGRTLQGAAVALLYLVSTPLVAQLMLVPLEPAPRPINADDLARSGAGAIVVLSGDSIDTPEYGGTTVGRLTLERLRYGARLARESGLPLLVTGGVLADTDRSIASVMRDTLTRDFGVPVRWIEDRSLTTDENARFSAEILRREGIGKIVLVTHAFHMRRAAYAFAGAGIDTIAAPTIFISLNVELGDFVPSARSFYDSFIALHEWIGLAWYRLNYFVAHSN